MLRDANAGVDFSDAYLETSVRILVPQSLAITRTDQLSGSKIGVIEDTTATERIRLELDRTSTKASIMAYSSPDALYDAFIRGEVDAIADDGVFLGAFQQFLSERQTPIETLVINSELSNEPISVVLDEDQSALKDLVNAVIAILKQAALIGVTKANIQDKLLIAQNEQPGSSLRLFFQLDAPSNGPDPTPLNTETITRIIESTGNINEIISESLTQTNTYVRELSDTLTRPF